MTRNFDLYVAREKNVVVSTDDEALLVWGEEGEGGTGAELLGLSFNTRKTFPDARDQRNLRLLASVATANDIPLIWIGKNSFAEGELELGEIDLLDDGNIQADLETVTLSEAPGLLQDYLGTDYDEMGTGKEENKRTAGGFHDWSRANLPRALKKQDLDILVTDGSEALAFIIELKRSYIDLDQWTPYRDDIRNYVLQTKLSEGAAAKPLIVYQNKERIDDDSLVTLFYIKDLDPSQRGENWIETERWNEIRAEALKAQLQSGNLDL